MKHYFVTLLVILFSFGLIYCVSDEEVQQYSNWLQSTLSEAQSKELRQDNSDYRPIDENAPPIDFGVFDFIIVGCGATGSILARRLSENPKWKILLLEAGGDPSNMTYTPMLIDASRFSDYNWGYKTVPQNHSCKGMLNQQCIVPRGRGIGGTTLVNGLIYVRGPKQDFDKWAGLGNPGWDYDTLLPLFKKTEGLVKNNPQAVVDWNFHGTTGPLHTEFYPSSDPQLEAFYNAFDDLGIPLTDVNSHKQIGTCPKPVQIKNGRRFDDGTAFVLPIQSRANLKIQRHSYVTKINFICKTAKSVTFSYQNKLYTARTRKEIIVSGGSINTAQLLMLSGVGPKKHLEELNIPVVKDLQVGQILREHPAYFGLLFSTNYTEPIKPFDEYVKEFLQGYGPLTLPGAVKAIAFYNTSFETQKEYPDMELMYISGNCTDASVKKWFQWTDDSWNYAFADVNPAKCFSLTPMLLDALSVGYVKLQSKDPYVFPLINPNHLAEQRDRQKMLQGIKLMLSAINTSPFKKLNAKLVQKKLPACAQYDFLSDDYWYCSMEQLTYNVFHPVGTCPMGPKPTKGDVVDHKLKVHGVKGLRVADASVFPFTLRGHPNAVCVAIGEKLAEMLKAEY